MRSGCTAPGQVTVGGLAVGAAHAVATAAAHIFLRRLGTPERPIGSVLVRHACASVIAQSCVLFGLLMCEIAGVLRHSTRWTLWHAELAAMVLVILGVIPVLQISLVLLPDANSKAVLARIRAGAQSLGVLLACFGAYAAIFWRLGGTLPISRCPALAEWPAVWFLLRTRPPIAELWSNETLRSFLALLLEDAVGRLGVLGVALMAGVSAFGAASGPYRCWNASRRASLGLEITDMESRLAHVCSLIARKEAELNAIDKESHDCRSRDGGAGPKTPSPVHSIGSTDADIDLLSTPLLHQRLFYLSARSSAQLSSDAQSHSQMASLRDLERDIKADLRSLRCELAAENAAPLLHRIMTSRAAGLALAAYGVATAARSASNVLWGSSSAGEDVASMIVHMAARRLAYSGPEVGLRLWTRTAALCIAAGMVASSMYALWPIAQRILRRALPSAHGSLAGLGLAQILGAYFIANVLMLRASIPPACGGLVYEGFADIRLEFYARWFDGAYAVSFVLASIALYIVTPS